jgi:hypothetical protein
VVKGGGRGGALGLGTSVAVHYSSSEPKLNLRKNVLLRPSSCLAASCMGPSVELLCEPLERRGCVWCPCCSGQ